MEQSPPSHNENIIIPNFVVGYHDTYQIIRCFHHTLFGKVFYAKPLKNPNITVVVKVYSKELILSKQIFENPAKEMEILNNLSTFHHPHICNLLDSIEDDIYLYAVLEYCSKGELFAFIEEQSSLSPLTSLKILSQIVDGLFFLHSNGIAHRDLSPENILISLTHNRIIIKICDFGASEKLEFNHDPNHQSSATYFPGKLYYIPPEQFNFGFWDWALGDVWQCGVLLFVMLTGRLPWSFPCHFDPIFNNIYNQHNVQSIFSSISLNVPTEISDLLLNMLCQENKRISLSKLHSRLKILVPSNTINFDETRTFCTSLM